MRPIYRMSAANVSRLRLSARTKQKPRASFDIRGLQPCDQPSANAVLTYMRVVPRRGLEPPHLSAHGPEPCASTNSATWALEELFALAGLLLVLLVLLLLAIQPV